MKVSSNTDDYTYTYIHPWVAELLYVLNKDEANIFLHQLSQLSNLAVLSVLSTYKNNLSDFQSTITKCIGELYSQGFYSDISIFLETRLHFNDEIAINISKNLLSEFEKVQSDGHTFILNLITPLSIISKSRDDLKNFLLSLLEKNNKLLTLTLVNIL